MKNRVTSNVIVEKGNVRRETTARAKEKVHQEPPSVKNVAEQVTLNLNVIEKEKIKARGLQEEKEKEKARGLKVEKGRVKVKVVIGWVLLK